MVLASTTAGNEQDVNTIRLGAALLMTVVAGVLAVPLQLASSWDDALEVWDPFLLDEPAR